MNKSDHVALVLFSSWRLIGPSELRQYRMFPVKLKKNCELTNSADYSLSDESTRTTQASSSPVAVVGSTVTGGFGLAY